MQPDPAQLDELVRRIVEAVHPLRIILFGSAARGEMGPNSDVDVLVVMPEGARRHRTALALYREVQGSPLYPEYVVATPSDLEKYGHAIGAVHAAALREGRELYAARGECAQDPRSGATVGVLAHVGASCHRAR
jgi:predicted nucleotidyltransferase